MATVRAIHVSAVKSLRLTKLAEAQIERDGIPGDRRFALLDPTGRVATQREIGAFAQIQSRYDPATGELALVLPDGTEVAAAVNGGRPASTNLWGRDIEGRAIDGPWSEAVSEAVGRPLTMLELPEGIRALDSHPVSLLSEASAAEVGRRGGRESFDPRRFRPTILVDGLGAHEEDEWVGRSVRAGGALLSVIRLDPRCALTTRDPETGQRDADTLHWLASYRRGDDGQVYCGLYADVLEPGRVAVGDTVEPLGDAG
ncbi:MAG: MOSC domain-containing protein [Gaiellales bacterium]